MSASGNGSSSSPSKAKKRGGAGGTPSLPPGTYPSTSKYAEFGVLKTDMWCPVCSKPVRQSGELSHIRGTKHTAAMLGIPVAEVNQHHLTITADAKFKCELCESSFKTIESMKPHLLTKVHMRNLDKITSSGKGTTESVSGGGGGGGPLASSSIAERTEISVITEEMEALLIGDP